MAARRVQRKTKKVSTEPKVAKAKRTVRAARSKPSKANAGDGNGGSSLTKMLSILDLFTPEAPVWSTNALIQNLGTSRATAYRYIRGLHTAGLIGAVGNGYYVLGPRIVELDLQIRRCDPLYKAGNDVLKQLTDATGHSSLLCMLFSSSVLCIREQLAPLSPENMFSRGQRRPLFFGAASKAILPYLPNHRLRNIYGRSQRVIAEAGLGSDWGEFRKTLAKFRKDGYVITCGEFNPGVMGVYAPIFNSERLILGSVGVSWLVEDAAERELAKVIIAVKRAARRITERVATTTTGMDRTPRAVG